MKTLLKAALAILLSAVGSGCSPASSSTRLAVPDEFKDRDAPTGTMQGLDPEPHVAVIFPSEFVQASIPQYATRNGSKDLVVRALISPDRREASDSAVIGDPCTGDYECSARHGLCFFRQKGYPAAISSIAENCNTISDENPVIGSAVEGACPVCSEGFSMSVRESVPVEGYLVTYNYDGKNIAVRRELAQFISSTVSRWIE